MKEGQGAPQIMEERHFVEEKNSMEEMHSREKGETGHCLAECGNGRMEERHSMEEGHSMEERHSMEEWHCMEEEHFPERSAGWQGL